MMAIAASLLLAAAGWSAPLCATCHPLETARYLASPMGNSLGPPAMIPGGRVVHEHSASTIAIEHRTDKMVHRLSERGFTAEYPIAYQIGAGNFAHSYLVEVNGYLFESPATWFRSYGWDVSPGYARAPAIDFDRPITETCLFCHSGNAGFSGTDGRRLATPSLTAITCERCHGSAADHMRRPSVVNIVNPRRLSARARDSVCEQCHLEGDARVLNPGKSWQDYRPGDPLERVTAVYVVRQDGHEVKAVSQVEQLAESRCASGSATKLWCGTCHNPHGQSADRSREIREICASCHATISKAAHAGNPSECVSCHMPRLSTEYAHVAVTDHRIVRPGVATETNGTGPKELAAWVDPPSEFRRRDLVLAQLLAGVRQQVGSISQAGLDLLKALPAAQYDDDPALLTAACDASLLVGRLQEALVFCRRAAARQPQSADRAMALGVALARSGDFPEAERRLAQAIQLDPSLKHAYVELWTLYDRQKKIAEMTETAEKYLRWNPQNIMFRVLHSTLTVERLLMDFPGLVLR